MGNCLGSLFGENERRKKKGRQQGRSQREGIQLRQLQGTSGQPTYTGGSSVFPQSGGEIYLRMILLNPREKGND